MSDDVFYIDQMPIQTFPAVTEPAPRMHDGGDPECWCQPRLVQSNDRLDKAPAVPVVYIVHQGDSGVIAGVEAHG